MESVDCNCNVDEPSYLGQCQKGERMRFCVTSVFLYLCFIGQGHIAPLFGQESGTQLTIEHEPLACLDAGKFPFVEAQVDAATPIQSARVYFKSHEAFEWYYVEMEAGSSHARAVSARLGLGGGETRPSAREA